MTRRIWVPGLRATGYLSGTKLESGAKVVKGQDGRVSVSASTQGTGDAVGAETGVPPTRPGGGGLLAATASVTTGERPATAEEWDRRGTRG